MISSLFDSTNPLLGIYSREDGIHLRAIATAPTEAEARELIAPMEAEIREIVGDAIWGEDDERPETQVGSLLLESGRTLGIMEWFTGGLLASSLVEVRGSLDILKGGVVVNGIDALEGHGVDRELMERYGPVSSEVAEAMAQAARRQFQADIGVSVTGVVTDPTPSSGPVGTTYTGFAVGDGSDHISGHYPTQRLRIRSRAVTHALLGLAQLLKHGDPRQHHWSR